MMVAPPTASVTTTVTSMLGLTPYSLLSNSPRLRDIVSIAFINLHASADGLYSAVDVLRCHGVVGFAAPKLLAVAGLVPVTPVDSGSNGAARLASATTPCTFREPLDNL